MEVRVILTQYEMIYAEGLAKKICKSMACETLRCPLIISYLRLLIRWSQVRILYVLPPNLANWLQTRCLKKQRVLFFDLVNYLAG